MSLPKTYSLAHSGWRQLTRVAELSSQKQGLVFPARLECLPCSRIKTIKTAGKRGECIGQPRPQGPPRCPTNELLRLCIGFKFFAVLFTNFNNKMRK